MNLPIALKHNRALRSFGRIRGRKLNEIQMERMERLLPRLRVVLPEAEGALLDVHSLGVRGRLWVEIGFGGGEHLAAQASNNPEAVCIGCEPYENGVASLLGHVDELNLHNIRVFQGDARLLLERLPQASVEKIFILFPDPWPKKRHQKRRIINAHTLNLIADVLKPGGELRLATDHTEYADWMLEHLAAHAGFVSQATEKDDFSVPPPDWTPTRYEMKTRKEGRIPQFLNYFRV